MNNNNNNPVVTTITISPVTLTVYTYTTQQFTAIVKDQNDSTMTGQTVAWSTTGNIGTVSGAGLLTATTTAQSGQVKASIGAVEGIANVTVQTKTYTLEVECDEGTYTSSANPTTNYGSETFANAGYQDTPSSTYYTFLKANLSSVPSTATISNAKLKVYISDLCGADIDIACLLATTTWDEDTFTSSSSMSLDMTLMPNYIVTGSDYDDWVEFDVTTFVQNWFDGTNDNYGVCLGAQGSNPGVDHYLGINSDDASSNKPKFVITAVY